MATNSLSGILKMIFLIFLLVGSGSSDPNATPCCEEPNVLLLDNLVCWNGKNVTAISCELKYVMGSNSKQYDEDVDIEVGEDGNLMISTDEDYGSIMVTPDKFCVARTGVNKTFSALVCHNKIIQMPSGFSTMLYVKNFCAFISVLFLLAVFIVYISIKELRDLEGKLILNFVGSIGVAHIVATLFTLIEHLDPTSCDRTAFSFYTLLLVGYNWLTVLSFHFWRLSLRPHFQTKMTWYTLYLCYGYGIPLLLAVTVVIAHFAKPKALHPGYDQCWYESGAYTVLLYFYGPVFLSLIVSTFLQSWGLKKVWIDVDTSMREEYIAVLRKKSLMYTHVLLIMVLNALTDILTFTFLHQTEALDFIWDLVDCRNLLIGGIFFFIFVVLRNKVLRALAKNGLFGFTFPVEWLKLQDEEIEKRIRRLRGDISDL